jgi:hypothetical protein
MNRTHDAARALLALLALGLMSTAALAAGPCTDDIAKLGRQLAAMPGLGAPISEPAAGLSVGQKTAQTGQTAPAAADKAQPGGASLAGGGSPGTVGGVAGPVGAATGSQQANQVATGQIATSPADVRLQSEGKPTMAQQAAQGQSVAAGSDDKASQAKMALQRATDLNAKNDASCKSEIDRAQALIGAH